MKKVYELKIIVYEENISMKLINFVDGQHAEMTADKIGFIPDESYLYLENMIISTKQPEGG